MPAAVADALGMTRILIHPLAGVLSAYGIGLADVKAIREASWIKPLGEDFGAALAGLEAARDCRLGRAGHRPRRYRHRAARAAAHAGQRQRRSRSIGRRGECATTFHTLHRQRFGYAEPDAMPVVEALVVRGAILPVREGTMRSMVEGHAPP